MRRADVGSCCSAWDRYAQIEYARLAMEEDATEDGAWQCFLRGVLRVNTVWLRACHYQGCPWTKLRKLEVLGLGTMTTSPRLCNNISRG